jgi:hypothetical protein
MHYVFSSVGDVHSIPASSLPAPSHVLPCPAVLLVLSKEFINKHHPVDELLARCKPGAEAQLLLVLYDITSAEVEDAVTACAEASDMHKQQWGKDMGELMNSKVVKWGDQVCAPYFATRLHSLSCLHHDNTLDVDVAIVHVIWLGDGMWI